MSISDVDFFMSISHVDTHVDFACRHACRFRLTALRQDRAIANAATRDGATKAAAPHPAARARAAGRRRTRLFGSCACARLPPSQKSEK
jgi:hypothetical protein